MSKFKVGERIWIVDLGLFGVIEKVLFNHLLHIPMIIKPNYLVKKEFGGTEVFKQSQLAKHKKNKVTWLR